MPARTPGWLRKEHLHAPLNSGGGVWGYGAKGYGAKGYGSLAGTLPPHTNATAITGV
jgi:hypothetical protein